MTLQDRLEDIDTIASKAAVLASIKKDINNEITEWCQCEDGYIVTGGKSMEDDLVEKQPCEDCSKLRERLERYIGR